MGLSGDYNNWTIRNQIQVRFIVSSFFLVSGLVLLSYFLLKWLESTLLSLTESAISDALLKHMQDLARYQSMLIESKAKSSFSYFYVYNYLVLKVLSQPSLFKTGTPVQDLTLDQNTFNYNYGCFMSRFTSLSPEGTELELLISSLDSILPKYENQIYPRIYSGFEIDEIIYYYPAALTVSRTYTPVVREWYYTAAESKYYAIITEPYQDSITFEWVLTFSKAILDVDENLYGVNGVDISINYIKDLVASVRVLDKGINLFASQGGVLITVPDIWEEFTNGKTVKIYDETVTGINSAKWESILLLEDGEQFSFTDPNSIEYVSVKYSISFDIDLNYTFYLLICADHSESFEQLNKIQSKFTEIYWVILWITISFSVITLCLICLLVYFTIRKFTKDLKRIIKFLSRTTKKGLYPRFALGIDTIHSHLNSEENSLANAIHTKLEKIDDIEDKYSNWKWGTTRPGDILLFESWRDCIYPYNRCNGEFKSWRQVLHNLDCISKRSHKTEF